MYALGTFTENRVTVVVGLICEFSILSHLIYMSAFVPVPHCVYYYDSVAYPDIGHSDTSSIVLFAQGCLGYLGFLGLPYKL